MPGPEGFPTAEQAPQEQADVEQPAHTPEAPETASTEELAQTLLEADSRARESTEQNAQRIAALADEAGRLAHEASGSTEPYVPQPPVKIDTGVGVTPNWTDSDERGADLAAKAYQARVAASGHSKPGDRSYDDLYPKAA